MLFRPRRLAVAVAFLAVVVLLDFVLERAIPDSSIRQLLMLAACNIVVALSLNIINGMAGQFSIGHAGFLLLGAYTSAIVSSHLHYAMGAGDVTFARSFVIVPLGLLASGLVAALFGFLVGLPSLRLKGDYLAIVTLGFAEILRLVIQTASASGRETVAAAWGHVGKDGVVGPFFHAIAVMIANLEGPRGYAGPNATTGLPLYAGPFWIFGLAGLAAVLAWRIKFSGWGRALRALREDEIAAAAVGVDPTRYKVMSFVVSAAAGGVAGGMMAQMRDGAPIVQPESFGFQASFDAITMVILGGSGSVTGAMLGGIFVTFSVKAIELAQGTAAVQSLRTQFPALDLNALRMMLYAALLIALMVLRPEGLLGERELFAKKKTKGGPPSASPGGAGGAPEQGARAEVIAASEVSS
ncbi:MAG: branched-chain amino acid ABC transporter permease [Myxococcales bacterium]|nr:branched-chain amino acid ABC transporter permease [Myxococcales bacterium]